MNNCSQELIDAIVAHLSPEEELLDLLSCRQVNRSFLTAGHRVLYSRVQIGPDVSFYGLSAYSRERFRPSIHSETLQFLSDMPKVLHLITDLTLQQQPWTMTRRVDIWENAPGIIRLLPNLSRFTLKDASFYGVLVAHLQELWMCLAEKPLVHLCLSWVKMPVLLPYWAYLTLSFPYLESLQLLNVMPTNFSDNADDSSSQLLGLLPRSVVPSSIGKMELSFTDSLPTEGLTSNLVKDACKIFDFDFLSAMSGIQKLHVGFTIGGGDYQGESNFLSHVVNNLFSSLEYLEIRLQYGRLKSAKLILDICTIH
jgi:hypothetical protein